MDQATQPPAPDELRLTAARAFLRSRLEVGRTDRQVFEWLDDTFDGHALDAALKAFSTALAAQEKNDAD